MKSEKMLQSGLEYSVIIPLSKDFNSEKSGVKTTRNPDATRLVVTMSPVSNVTVVNIVIGTITCPVVVAQNSNFVLSKTVASLLNVQARALSTRLDRAGLGNLIVTASPDVVAAFRASGAITNMERSTRVLLLETLDKVPSLGDKNGHARITTLVSEGEQFRLEAESTGILEVVNASPESPKDKAKRMAVMPTLGPKVHSYACFMYD
jgi:hypothetical protein